MNRRDWLKEMGAAGGIFLISPAAFACGRNGADPSVAQVRTSGPKAKVAFVKTSDRAEGVKRAIELLGYKDEFKGKSVFVKPNFNSADVFPGSTHNDTLLAVTEELRGMGAKDMTIGDRSGMGDTAAVMRSKDIPALAKDQSASTLVFDDLKDDDWKLFRFENSLWKNGFAIPKPVLAAEAIVQTCCLKTHRFGGHFTLSLKNSVGLAAKRIPGNPYNFMSELHSSPNQRRMIAEINASYNPSLVVLDGVEAFTDGGPDKGTRVASNVIIAGTDRVAVDAVGVAVLRHFGTTANVSKGTIFEQDQIAQAAKLGLGVTAPEQIEILTDSGESREYASEIGKQFSYQEEVIN
ncbi:MAG: DUF362 domain-containing protein [Acidobacteria bacterium]|nr:MAG: DUF362 domain-containing protein [Acidobacteriota bacterium]REJ98940.1 MAG: DUF362 domain-containing protein [Acidobacteriota bacterium]REK16340.1 MAG: DUF362 domain-containing protein [Acidobacteriota bacterium]REK44021.1 MAG: DUF362 domain-containing protein [Acidobacteriota bacterium]